MRRRRTPTALLTAVVAAATVAALGGSPGAAARPEGGDLVLTTVATLSNPVAMATRAGTDDLYVAQRNGEVRRLVVDGSSISVAPGRVADLRSRTEDAGEQGLFGLAFDPAGTRLYLHFTNNAGDTRLVEYRMNGGGTGNAVVASSRRTVLALDQPFANHNGGTVTFGPDGFLYLALGDGGGSGDPRNRAQNRRSLLGKVLRIDPRPSGARSFRAPRSNPFGGAVPGKRAIWLYGVRNPWRISFDTATGDLYVADVGQNAFEEVTVLPADGDGRNAGRGANLGWRRMEGPLPFAGTEPANHTGPTVSYPHPGGTCTSVTGGHVYRGSAVAAALDGAYVYGDFCTGEVFRFTAVDGVVASAPANAGISVPPFNLLSFGQDAAGEIYLLLANGQIRRIDPI